ncbi:type III-A CRISPR-associated RAMP protein Csm4 [Petralouisia muris]|uniref:Type III-A CRISPR-associated RAMP protein Csm4 n=1 Tax=Petralouisia muris TaxID=3032872 RepID=A0AC61RYU3_9FIRM|nr:type III-A CRISPR-associated RAMP protein Csm4 [Petralouisia muris]TGY97291.1 type III-A CRISPR-associated RAMP protein Csm4 [Petralouisia muris]
MEYRIYKFDFTAGVHFGENSLEHGGFTLCADTLFSALCQECIKQGPRELKQLVSRAREGKICLTDAFPYIENIYYLPKPVLKIETEEQRGDSTLKKAYKKLAYVPADKWEDYIAGKLDVIHEFNRFQESLGYREIKTSAAVRGMEETKPYRVGIYHFCSGNGLYIIAGGESEEDIQLLETGLASLELSGIGGKRNAGLGRYQLKRENVLKELQCRLACGKMMVDGEKNSKNLERPDEAQEGAAFMALSVCLPREEELEGALEQAGYLLLKRSGFVASETYAKEQLRKRDMYVMQAGSCFRKRFEGDIYDVSDGGSHPVYRYAKPMFLEVIS